MRNAVVYGNEVNSITFNPQTETLPYKEGQIAYNSTSHAFELHGAHPDVTLQIGQEMHMHVQNNTGSIIPNGAACKQAGVVGGIVQAELALADTFDNARLIGISTHDIGIGEEGVLTTFGLIHDLNTLTIEVGVPLYLSDTNPGEWTETAPAIITRVGGIFEQSETEGILFVYIINNKNLPSIFGSLTNHTATNEVYPLTTVIQDMKNFLVEDEIVVVADALNGIITLPNDGYYRMNVSASFTFTSLPSSRSITLEYYDVTNTTVLHTFTTNVPRDSVADSFNFTFPFTAVTDNQYKLRIKATEDMTVTFTSIVFDIESINLR